MASSYFTHTNPTAPTNSSSLLASPQPSSPGSVTTPAAARPSALATKLTSVLSASYSDAEIRDALETLDARGFVNEAENRRLLRLEVQGEVVECNGAVVRDFGKVAEQLRRIGSVISSLNQTCDDMRKHINLARQETAPVLEEAASLTAQKHETETKRQLLDAFGQHFLVSEDDLAVLSSAAEPVDNNFFRILARVKQIYRDCEVLLGGENQRLGLEIMEQSSKNLNAAFQKLYRWIQREFKSLNLEDPQIGGAIRMALRVLAERPALFQSCLDHFAEAREYILTEAFHKALTETVGDGEPGAGTGRGGLPSAKPIEFSAHDPLRYVGDMLAWVHSAAVSEREALEALFISDGDEIAKGIQAGIDSQPWNKAEGEEEYKFDGQKALNDLVNRDLSGVARSLHQRVELVVQSHDDVLTTYKVMNLLTFYNDTFAKLIGADSNLNKTIAALERSSFSHFESLIQDEIAMLSSDTRALAPSSNFEIPEYLSLGLNQLSSLMKVYSTSFRASMSDPDSKDSTNAFTPILDIFLSPLLSLTRTSTASLSSTTNHLSQIIFDTNVHLAVQDCLTAYSFTRTSAHLDSVKTHLRTLRDTLIKDQHVYLVSSSGLEPQLAAITSVLNPTPTDPEPEIQASTQRLSPRSPRPKPKPEPDLSTLSSHPAFQPPALSASSQTLDAFLPSALMDALARLQRVRSVPLVRELTEEAVELFVRDFEGVEGVVVGLDFIVDEGDGDEEEDGREADGERVTQRLRDVFPRTSGEIRVLLS